jgi:hypothetical protein
MTRSTDFSAYFVAKWNDGQMPKARPGNTVVSYNQSNVAYDIADSDMPDFVEWVAWEWWIDRDPRDDDEPASEYLDRIGVRTWVAS